MATFTREDDELLAERLADADTDTTEKININCGLPAKMLPLCTPKLKTQHVSFAECLSARHSLQLLAKYKYCSAQSTYTTAGATLLLTIYTSNTTTSLLSSLYEYTQLTALLA
eukprot:18879-Heterococcus_DN1.PRE.1